MVFLKSLKFIICLLFMIWKPLLLFNKFSHMFHILITLCKCQIVKLGAIEIAKTLSTSTIKYCVTFHRIVNKSNHSFVTSKTHLKVNLHWPNLLSKTQATIDKVISHWLNGQINPYFMWLHPRSQGKDTTILSRIDSLHYLKSCYTECRGAP